MEIYCTERCRDEAWGRGHRLVCVAHQELAAEVRMAVGQLYRRCIEEQRVFPLLALKLLCRIECSGLEKPTCWEQVSHVFAPIPRLEQGRVDAEITKDYSLLSSILRKRRSLTSRMTLRIPLLVIVMQLLTERSAVRPDPYCTAVRHVSVEQHLSADHSSGAPQQGAERRRGASSCECSERQRIICSIVLAQPLVRPERGDRANDQ